jgi:hypothetical protein
MGAVPFAPAPARTAAARDLALLLAPPGQLSGDGQLRELMQERRDRLGPDVELWYLPTALVQKLGLNGDRRDLREAVVAGEASVITWLQLRFGGERATALLSPARLHGQAADLPPPAPLARLGLQGFNQASDPRP